MRKRIAFFLLALTMALAIVSPLVAVPASAADYIDSDSITVALRRSVNTGSWNQYYSLTNTMTGSSTETSYRFGLTNGTSEADYILFPVGSDLDSVYVSSYLSLDASSVDPVYTDRRIVIELYVLCYDSDMNSIGTVYTRHVVGDSYSGSGVATLSCSGVQFPSGTVYFSPRLLLCSRLYNNLSSTGHYGVTGTFSGSAGFAIHTDDIDWASPGFDTVDSVDPVPFHFSHSGQTVNLSKNDDLVFFVMAEGFAGVDMYARFNFWGGSTKTVQLYYDSDRVSHYNAFQYLFPDINGYDMMWVDFLIDGNVVYSTDNVTMYYPQWDGSGDGSASDSQISESITEVKEDIQAVMDAVGELDNKLSVSDEDAVAGEQFQEDTDGKVDEFNNAMDDLNSVERPDISDIDTSVEGMIGADAMTGLSQFFGRITSFTLIGSEIFISVTLALVSYVFFGKKG